MSPVVDKQLFFRHISCNLRTKRAARRNIWREFLTTGPATEEVRLPITVLAFGMTKERQLNSNTTEKELILSNAIGWSTV